MSQHENSSKPDVAPDQDMQVEMKALETGGAAINEEVSSQNSKDDMGADKQKETGRFIDNLNPFLFFKRLYNVFGFQLLFLLFCSQHVLKGLIFNVVNNPVKIIFGPDYLQIPAQRMQVLLNVKMVPWALKPVIGLLSDYFPIFGYHKIPYTVLVTIGGMVGMALIGFCHIKSVSGELITGALFLIMLQLSTCDLLTEAVYARNMKEHAADGPSLMTYVWGGINVAGLIGTPIAGWLVSHFNPQLPYIVAILPGAMMLIPSFFNYFGDVKKTSTEVRENRQNLWDNPSALIMCVLMLICSVALTVTGIAVESIAVNAAVAFGVTIIIIVGFFLLLNPTIALVNAYFIIQASLTLSTEGAATYFYLDNEKAYPAGPHFDKNFFITVLPLVGNIMSLVGVLTYQMWMSNWRYRSLLYFTNTFVCILSMLDVVFYTRANVAMGIPDHLFVLGSTASQVMIQQWQWMPGVVILAHLCPHGLEATIYALLAGCHNLGMNIASIVGALLLQWLGVDPSGGDNDDSAQFKNMWVASLIASLLPMITMFLVPIMIPNASQNDTILTKSTSATTGSVLEKYMVKKVPDNENEAVPSDTV